ncbi:MAG: GerMN domain-containing protein [Acidimicrobiales bacterium]
MTRSPNAAGRHRALVVASVLTLVLAACAMPSNSEPQSISVGTDFEELLAPAPPESTTTTESPERTREVGFWFIVDDELNRESRQLPLTRARDAFVVLEELLAGTRQENYRSAIPSGVEVLETRLSDESGILTIVLTDETLFAVGGTDLTRAIAQIVFTLTGIPGVEQVRFEIDESVRSVPTGSGSDTREPVGPCDYLRFRPELRDCPDSTTTTTSPAPASESTLEIPGQYP